MASLKIPEKKRLSMNKEIMHELFNYFDTDSSGTLDENEIVSMLQKLFRYSPSSDEIKHWIDVLDDDGDGGISFDDLHKYSDQDALFTAASRIMLNEAKATNNINNDQLLPLPYTLIKLLLSTTRADQRTSISTPNNNNNDSIMNVVQMGINTLNKPSGGWTFNDVMQAVSLIENIPGMKVSDDILEKSIRSLFQSLKSTTNSTSSFNIGSSGRGNLRRALSQPNLVDKKLSEPLQIVLEETSNALLSIEENLSTTIIDSMETITSIVHLCLVIVIVPIIISAVFISIELPVGWPTNIIVFMTAWIFLGISISIAFVYITTTPEDDELSPPTMIDLNSIDINQDGIISPNELEAAAKLASVALHTPKSEPHREQRAFTGQDSQGRIHQPLRRFNTDHQTHKRFGIMPQKKRVFRVEAKRRQHRQQSKDHKNYQQQRPSKQQRPSHSSFLPRTVPTHINTPLMDDSINITDQ